MAADDQLKKSLSAINCNALTSEFLADPISVSAIASACERLALWSNEIRYSEPDNPAAPFLLEMQRSSHDVAILLATALYVPAAAAMRTACETALYYTYFRSHLAELTTLAIVPDYHVTKEEILEYHKTHSPTYRRVSKDFGFPGNLNAWYGNVSAIIHGQLPGTWGHRMALAETKHDQLVLKTALETFTKGIEVIHLLLHLTVGVELWGRFHHETKRALLKGMSAQQRGLLGLDGKQT